uniref:Carboxylesterase type B domain-containing protein n=1 Tax=Strongyloides venezuelensis TaxID=75913 RepID=A0A0K0FSY0_STRVS
MHGDDLIDVFGIPFRHPEKYKSKNEENEEKKSKEKDSLNEEQTLSERVMWTIGNFSKYGNTTANWQQAKADNLTAFIFNGTSSFDNNKNMNFTPPTCVKFFKLMKDYTMRIMRGKTEIKKKPNGQQKGLFSTHKK